MIDCSSPGYYTPDINQLCVGFEFEYNHSLGYKESFEPVVIGIRDKNGNYSHQLSEIVDSLDDGMAGARVPFLTPNQLLEEFTYSGRANTSAMQYGTHGIMMSINQQPIQVNYDFATQNMSIILQVRENGHDVNPWMQRVIFSGRVRCINELREVKRLLQIEILVGSVHSSQIENI